MKTGKNDKWWIDFFQSDFTEVVLNQQAAETVHFMQQIGQLLPGMKILSQEVCLYKRD